MLRLAVRRSGATIVVEVAGEVDISNASRLWTDLRALIHAGYDLTIDLAGLEFLGAAGMGALVRAHNEAADRRQTVTLRHPSRPVARALAAAHVDTVLNVEP